MKVLKVRASSSKKTRGVNMGQKRGIWGILTQERSRNFVYLDRLWTRNDSRFGKYAGSKRDDISLVELGNQGLKDDTASRFMVSSFLILKTFRILIRS